jgi:CheY-like chemotaxis protein
MYGYEVRVTYDGPQALEAALRWRPEFILLDIGMPGMDGYAVARQLRQEPAFGGTVIIAVTGYGQKADLQHSRAAGIDHHLLKPVEWSELLPLLSNPDRASLTGG